MKRKPAKRAATRKRKPTGGKTPASITVPYRKRGAFGQGSINAILDDGYSDLPANFYQRGYEV